MKVKMIEVMHEAADILIGYPAEEITLFHHNDTDGLCSGALLSTVFSNSGYKVSRHALEKPYPQILDKVFTGSGQIVVFADFAGRIAPLISEKNEGRNLVLILDHHPAEDVEDPCVINIDAELFGLKGDRDISASAVCYLFAEVFMKGKGVDHLSHLGVLGAIGDGFMVDGALSGINREIFEFARERGLMRSERAGTRDRYFIRLGDKEYCADSVCEALDIAGGVGYYQNGPALGVTICLEGFSDDIWMEIKELRFKKDSIFSREMKNLETNIRTTEHLQWFDVKDRFKPMGVKMIGVFCNEIKDIEFLDQTKYLAGFQIVPNVVPGFGAVSFNSSKISMRVSTFLTERIRSGEYPGLNNFLPEATEKLGGFVDACHGLSAATTVKLGEEELLIGELEKELGKRVE